MTLVTPAEGMEAQLGNVDQRINDLQGNQPTAVVQAAMAVAQVNATCALVHAVRELTDEVRKLAGPEE